jgi:transmembrane sensor
MTLDEQIRAASRHVDAGWDEARSTRVGQQLSRAVAAKTAAKVMVAKGLTVAAFSSLVALGLYAARTKTLTPSDLAPGTAVPTSTSPLLIASGTPERPSPSASATQSMEGPPRQQQLAPSIAGPPEEAPAKSASSGAVAPRGSAGHALIRAPDVTWRSLAEQGRFDEAYEALRGSESASLRDEVGDLLLAADVARLSKHPGEGAGYLRKILDKHRSDPRAALAAFTLGRVLLDQLGQPREAAGAFTLARTLAPSGALAEDALAREVEAWSRAGDASAARSSARDYLERFPGGRRASSVRKFGGVD